MNKLRQKEKPSCGRAEDEDELSSLPVTLITFLFHSSRSRSVESGFGMMRRIEIQDWVWNWGNVRLNGNAMVRTATVVVRSAEGKL